MTGDVGAPSNPGVSGATNPAPAAPEVYYRGDGGELDTILRDVLHQRWRGRCHGCKRPTPFHEITIDHLIPHGGITSDELEGLKQRHNLPAEFDVERPANLAPACGGCNNEKGARLLGEFQLDLRLGKAAEYAPEVIANVLAYVTSGKVSRYLRVIRAADLTDPATRTAFERDAPGVVQSLALLDEGKADFLAPRPVDLSDLGYPGLVVAVSVNARGRAALAVLEGICRASLHDALELAVDDLVKQICDRTRVVLGSVGINAGRPLTAGEPECDWLRVSVDSMDFARAAADLLLTSDGSFEGRLTTPVRDTGYLGGTTSEIEVAGRFQLGAAWPIATAAGSPQSRTCQITQWSNGVVMTY